MCGDLVAFQSHNAYMCVCVLGVRERILPLLNSCFHEKKKKRAQNVAHYGFVSKLGQRTHLVQVVKRKA